MDLSKLVEIDEKMGLTGTELQTFIRDEQEAARAERRLAREHEMQHEKEMAILQNEIAVAAVGSNVIAPKMHYISGLPCFNEHTDSIDYYLRRFECYAVNQGCDASDYAVFVSALLTGYTLEVYSRLPASVANDYDHLKQSLIEWYQLTKGDFRRKFYSCTPSSKETIPQFYVRMVHYLNQWISLSGIDESFEAPSCFLRKIFLFVCPRNLSVFMREHKPKVDEELLYLLKTFTNACFPTGSKGIQREQSRSYKVPPPRLKRGFKMR